MKYPKKKYLKISPEKFRSWIVEIMNEPKFYYADAKIVAKEIEHRFGGLASSHLYKIRAMRIDVRTFVNNE